MQLPMSTSNSISVLGEWEGYRVGRTQRVEGVKGKGCEEVWIELLPEETGSMVCSACGGKAKSIHEVSERMIRDLPILGAKTWLFVKRRRVLCERCGPKLERLSWLDRHQRVTKRFAESIVRLCEVLAISQVALYFDLGWETVKNIHKRALKRRLEPVELSGLEVIAMDEFAIQKGQQYATCIVNPKNKQVLWVGRGRGREDIRPFFQLLGPERCKALKAVAMDMNGAYEQEVRSHCPNAQIVYDLFHVLAKYGREVVDKVRAEEGRRLQQADPSRKLVQGSRWLLLRDRANLSQDNEVRLSELLAANRNLFKVYLLKEDLKDLWQYRHPAGALKAWHHWYHRACCSRLVPLKKFAKRLKAYVHGIVSHCRWPLHTSLLEGMNNKIKVIKRVAYGFRDDEYFFLRIRAAFPGVP